MFSKSKIENFSNYCSRYRRCWEFDLHSIARLLFCVLFWILLLPQSRSKPFIITPFYAQCACAIFQSILTWTRREKFTHQSLQNKPDSKD